MSTPDKDPKSTGIIGRIKQVESILRQFGVSRDLLREMSELQERQSRRTRRAKVHYSREFDDLFGFSTDALTILEPETTVILKTNGAFTDITGMSSEHLVGTRMGDMTKYSGHSLEQVVENLQKATVDGFNNFELLAKDLLMNSFTAEVRLKPISLKGKTYVLNAIIDQSPESVLRQRLMALQKERRELKETRVLYGRLSFITNAVPQALFSCDVSGQITFCNSRFLEITGLKEDNCERWQELIHADDRFAFKREWTRALNTGTTVESECRMTRMPSDSLNKPNYRWYQVTALATRDDSGDVCELIGSITEIDKSAG